MMGSMMKNPTDVLTLQVQCGGPIGGMTVTADSKGEVKGYVHNPDVMLPPKNGKLDVGGALGPGFLNVIKDMGLKEPYSGQTILQTGEIAEDLTYYFATSEQVPSSVGLGVLMEKDNTVRCAGGFIRPPARRRPAHPRRHRGAAGPDQPRCPEPARGAGGALPAQGHQGRGLRTCSRSPHGCAGAASGGLRRCKSSQ